MIIPLTALDFGFVKLAGSRITTGSAVSAMDIGDELKLLIF